MCMIIFQWAETILRIIMHLTIMLIAIDMVIIIIIIIIIQIVMEELIILIQTC